MATLQTLTFQQALSDHSQWINTTGLVDEADGCNMAKLSNDIDAYLNHPFFKYLPHFITSLGIKS